MLKASMLISSLSQLRDWDREPRWLRMHATDRSRLHVVKMLSGSDILKEEDMSLVHVNPPSRFSMPRMSSLLLLTLKLDGVGHFCSWVVLPDRRMHRLRWVHEIMIIGALAAAVAASRYVQTALFRGSFPRNDEDCQMGVETLDSRNHFWNLIC